VTLAARCQRFCHRLKADAIKGSAAIEFALIAPVFFILLMGTIETGVIFFAQSTLQNAVNDAARMVRTGQTGCFTTDSGGNCQAMTQAQFRTQICGEASAILQDCNGTSLQFDVQAYPSGFSSANNGSPLDGSGNLPVLSTFNVGAACDVVLVRAFYKWPVFTPLLGFFLENAAGGIHLVSTAAAFRNEPYNSNMDGCS
jgi:Flp pilus assembly protein TadG